MSKRILMAVGIIMGLGAAPYALSTCPTTFHQDKEGYWISDDAPGWKSHQPTGKDVKISEQQFGGAVYSPVKKRIACVYKGSHGRWVALISSQQHPFNEDDLNMSAWMYSKKHNDYICGKPKHGLSACTFSVKGKAKTETTTAKPTTTEPPTPKSEQLK